MTGVLVGAWGDPHPRSPMRGALRFALALPNGGELPLDLSNDASAGVRLLGHTVTVTGRTLPGPVASPMEVDALEANDRTVSATGITPKAGTSGTRRVLYLLVKYSDDTAVPHSPGFYSDLNNPDAPPAGSSLPATVNQFFLRTSFGQLRWAGDVGGTGGVPATGWLTLPKPKSGYANCGWSGSCAQLGTLFNDAMALAVKTGIDVSVYDNVHVVLANDLDCCSWGGSQSYNGKSYGVTWEPPWGQDVSTYVHEMGHSLGLPHSGWDYYSYDSPWDIMSGGPNARSVSCGSYYSRNSSGNDGLVCTDPGAGYLASYVDKLGWLSTSNVVQANAGDSRTITLQALTQPVGAGVKMIRICLPGESCSGSTAHYLTVEARVRATGDLGIPGEGVLIHDFRANRGAIGAGDACFTNSSSVWAQPIDATPNDFSGAPTCSSGGRSYPQYALYNAQWVTGQVYSDSAHNVRIGIGARSGSSWTITLGSGGGGSVGNVSVPGRPTNVRATPDDARVALNWGAVTGATSYQILMATTSGAESATPVRNGITGTSVTIGSLTNGTTYYFQVVAVNSAGRSARSAEVSATPMRYVTRTVLNYTALSASAGETRSYSRWIPSGARNLRVRASGGTGDADLYVKFDTAPASSTVLNDRANCVPYKVGNDESCMFISPSRGRWYISLYAKQSFANVALVVEYQVPAY